MVSPPSSCDCSKRCTPEPVVLTVVRPSTCSETMRTRTALLPMVNARELDSVAMVPPKSPALGPMMLMLLRPAGMVTVAPPYEPGPTMTWHAGPTGVASIAVWMSRVGEAATVEACANSEKVCAGSSS